MCAFLVLSFIPELIVRQHSQLQNECQCEDTAQYQISPLTEKILSISYIPHISPVISLLFCVVSNPTSLIAINFPFGLKAMVAPSLQTFCLFFAKVVSTHVKFSIIFLVSNTRFKPYAIIRSKSESKTPYVSFPMAFLCRRRIHS